MGGFGDLPRSGLLEQMIGNLIRQIMESRGIKWVCKMLKLGFDIGATTREPNICYCQLIVITDFIFRSKKLLQGDPCSLKLVYSDSSLKLQSMLMVQCKLLKSATLIETPKKVMATNTDMGMTTNYCRIG